MYFQGQGQRPRGLFEKAREYLKFTALDVHFNPGIFGYSRQHATHLDSGWSFRDQPEVGGRRTKEDRSVVTPTGHLMYLCFDAVEPQVQSQDTDVLRTRLITMQF